MYRNVPRPFPPPPYEGSGSETKSMQGAEEMAVAIQPSHRSKRKDQCNSWLAINYPLAKHKGLSRHVMEVG